MKVSQQSNCLFWRQNFGKKNSLQVRFTVIQKLPVELKQNLLNIKSLDEKAQELSQNVEEGLMEVVNGAKVGKKLAGKPPGHLTKLRADLSKAFDLSEEKIGLAAQTYEMVSVLLSFPATLETKPYSFLGNPPPLVPCAGG